MRGIVSEKKAGMNKERSKFVGAPGFRRAEPQGKRPASFVEVRYCRLTIKPSKKTSTRILRQAQGRFFAQFRPICVFRVEKGANGIARLIVTAQPSQFRGDKSPAQYMEAVATAPRDAFGLAQQVGFNRLP